MLRSLPTLCTLVCFICLPSFSQELSFLNALVKVYVAKSAYDINNPWRMHGSHQVTGSGCIIEGRKIITNAHVVSNQRLIQVRKNGEAKKYIAKFLVVAHEPDLALLTVEGEDADSFFSGVDPIPLGLDPKLRDELVVLGFPLGGDTLSFTKGVLSRFEYINYVHSLSSLLAGQIDAAVNPGNSGGPVLSSDGQIVGVVMQGISGADNIGYMIPASVIRHFLEDVKDTRYDGYPSFGVLFSRMENPALKKKYQLQNLTGVLALNVSPGAASEYDFQTGDVLLKVDRYDIADDGTISFRDYERTRFTHAITQLQVGSNTTVDVLRDGKKMEKTIQLNRKLQQDNLILPLQYDQAPDYYIFGGLVFMPLSMNHILNEETESETRHFFPILLRNLPQKPGEEVVVLVKVLADQVNQGYHGFDYTQVVAINGEEVLNLKHLIELIEESEQELVDIDLKDGWKVVLDRREAELRHQAILDNYGVPRDRSLSFHVKGGECQVIQED